MSNVSDLTLEVLKDIRSDLRALNERVERGFADVNGQLADVNERLADVNERLADVNQRIDGTNQRIDGTNQRLDGVIKIVGGHHTELESRVSRIENHLGLPRDH